MTSKNLEVIINKMDNEISKEFSKLIGKDIKTSYNALDIVTDENDKVSFLSDSQLNNKIKNGVDISDIFSSDNNKTTVGRVIRRILKENGKEYTNDEITDFVTKFKAAFVMAKMQEDEKSPIRIVNGEDIRHWYYESNYCYKTLSGYGTLGKSCMKYDICQNFLGIYVKNTEVCNLLIFTMVDSDNEEKLLARALLWKTDRGYFLDRVYYTHDSDVEVLKDWVKNNYPCELFYPCGLKLEVKLNENTSDYITYPYMDSLVYYYITDKKLFNYKPKVDNKYNLLYCQDTDGEYLIEDVDTIYCELLGEYFNEDDVVYSEYHSSYIPSEYSAWSSYHNSEIYTELCAWCKDLRDYVDSDIAVSVLKSKENDRERSYYPKDSDLIFFDENDGRYYLKSLFKNEN